MAETRAIKVAATALAGAAGAAVAALAGAPEIAAAIALLTGIGAYAVSAPGQPAVGATPPPAEAPPIPLPGPNDLLDAVSEPMLLVRERRVLIANRAARALLGDHVEGSDVRLAIRHPAAAERLIDDGCEGEVTELIGLGDLGRQWEMVVTPLPDGSRTVRLRDQSQARAAEQMRVNFVANASHELRTPLATLLGFLETLEDEAAGGDAATRNRFLGIMSGEARRMRDLIDDLMSLSRIEADRYTLPRDKVALADVVAEVETAVAVVAAGRALLVEDRASGALVTGDRGQLAQMLSNLVVNALKYGRDGTPVRIGIAPAEGGLVRLSVSDEGEGIPSEHIPRLTERFYRVDAGRSRQVGGTGLGLAIVKHIVLRHRGRLDIASQPGLGTTVGVCLPLAEPLSSKSHAGVTEGSPSGPSPGAEPA
ncbi:MAG TPA: ATP-binding protein [Allosphingosinicella sp.]|nr:ATP-binding protein [Allosphingosinicella sp.]